MRGIWSFRNRKGEIIMLSRVVKERIPLEVWEKRRNERRLSGFTVAVVSV